MLSRHASRFITWDSMTGLHSFTFPPLPYYQTYDHAPKSVGPLAVVLCALHPLPSDLFPPNALSH
jgi:hypothetical protein